MFQPFVSLRRVARWVVRFRHRRGYGIHSPFAFNVVKGVIYESGEFYAYAPLHAWRQDHTADLREKDDRLLFRLINHSRARRAVVVGPVSDVTLRYLHEGRSSCRLTVTDTLTADARNDETCDFAYVNHLSRHLDGVMSLTERMTDGGLIVVRGIGRHKTDRAAWQRLVANECVRVSFDLYDFGLAFLESRLHKEHHVINYF
ncbi:MAG: hypothetical protein ACI4V2_00665 [Alloprevotella sp.]